MDVRSHTRYHLVYGTSGFAVGNDEAILGEETEERIDAGDGSGAPAKSAKPLDRLRQQSIGQWCLSIAFTNLHHPELREESALASRRQRSLLVYRPSHRCVTVVSNSIFKDDLKIE